MRALLDVNVLIALLDQRHEHHEAAHHWLEENVQYGWATCATTQNGALRIMSHPKYADENPWPAHQVAESLVEMTDAESHQFWPDASPVMPGVIDWHQVRPSVRGSKQITDLHLLALAAKNNGRLVTFDGHIAKSAVLIADDEAYCVLRTP